MTYLTWKYEEERETEGMRRKEEGWEEEREREREGRKKGKMKGGGEKE